MSNRLTYAQVQDYINDLVPPRNPEVQAMEAYAKENNFPIIGPAAGYLCYQIARMIDAHHVFEMGSGYGYSTVWFAKAVKENGGGVVHHVVWDEELSQKAQKHLSKLGYEGMVKYTVAEAVETLNKYAGSLDLIFMDINKGGYPTSLPIIEEKLRPGGVLIVDNMLWSGRIFDQQDQDTSTKAIRKLTELLVNNPKWIITLLPVRDGLIVAYKQ